jgi:hypothetical protein
MTEQKKTYVCGVCRQVKEGSPAGGFNTIHGEVVTCSGKCFVEGMTKGQPVTANAMHAAASRASKPS